MLKSPEQITRIKQYYITVILSITKLKIFTNKNFIGHYDKQPHFTGWKEGFGPTTPVIKDDNLYGRGASDDGYAIFAAVNYFSENFLLNLFRF